MGALGKGGGRTSAVYLSGTAAAIEFAGLLALILAMMSYVVGRGGVTQRTFAGVSVVVGLALWLLGMIWAIATGTVRIT